MSLLGPDGQPRCDWAVGSQVGSHQYLGYHDAEWGRPVSDDRGLYERLTLECFQSGLSWLTILRKRPAFRAAFANFDPVLVAAFSAADRERLLSDAGIVRNRAKIDAAIGNAQLVLDLLDLGGSLSELLWSYAPAPGPAPRHCDDVPAATAESTAMARDLKRRGFAFVGPTTCYALMQATGMVNDHLADCVSRTATRPGQRPLNRGRCLAAKAATASR